MPTREIQGSWLSMSSSWQPKIPPTMAAVVSVSPPKATARFKAVARSLASRRTCRTLATVARASSVGSAVVGGQSPLAARRRGWRVAGSTACCRAARSGSTGTASAATTRRWPVRPAPPRRGRRRDPRPQARRRLNHLPSGSFATNAAWLTLNVLAYNLARWTSRIRLDERLITTKTLRTAIWTCPAGCLAPRGDGTCSCPPAGHGPSSSCWRWTGYAGCRSPPDRHRHHCRPTQPTQGPRQPASPTAPAPIGVPAVAPGSLNTRSGWPPVRLRLTPGPRRSLDSSRFARLLHRECRDAPCAGHAVFTEPPTCWPASAGSSTGLRCGGERGGIGPLARASLAASTLSCGDRRGKPGRDAPLAAHLGSSGDAGSWK
jgi:hypothetical protein